MRFLPLAAATLFAAGLSLSAFAETAPTPPAPPAPQPAPTAPVDPEQAKKDAYDNEVVCRTEDETGSRLRKTKICATRKEWRAAAQDAQDAASNAQRRGAQGGAPGN